MDAKALFTKQARSIKKRFLSMYKAANSGHIACSLSCADILVFTKFFWMKEKDNLILSKGHAAGALYSVLAEAGDISEEEVLTFCNEGTCLGAHPPGGKIKNIPFATGSLGHGLPLSAGMALAAKLREQERLFFCVSSDGELNEGSCWEAALFIAQHKLNNIVWLIDRNNLQAFGRTEEVLSLEPLTDKLESFGFFVTEADGHDYSSLETAKQACLEKGRDRPKAVVCATTKGRGVSFMENKIDWHYLPMSDEQYETALRELSGA